jgi:hypothetical protein
VKHQIGRSKIASANREVQASTVETLEGGQSADPRHRPWGAGIVVNGFTPVGFASHPTARDNALVIGLIVAMVALWAMLVETDLRKWMSDWMHRHHVLR